MKLDEIDANYSLFSHYLIIGKNILGYAEMEGRYAAICSFGLNVLIFLQRTI